MTIKKKAEKERKTVSENRISKFDIRFWEVKNKFKKKLFMFPHNKLLVHFKRKNNNK